MTNNKSQSIEHIDDCDDKSKRRGRPKKAAQNPNNKKPLYSKKDTAVIEHTMSMPKEEEIILRLPININVEAEDMSESEFVTTTEMEHSTGPNIFQPRNDSKRPRDAVFTVGDSDYESSSESESGFCDDPESTRVSDLLNTIQLLEQELAHYRVEEAKQRIKGINGRMVAPLKLDNLITTDPTTKKQLLAESTDICCLWCGYNFDTPPCFLPHKYYADKYHVFGNFCSIYCAAAYNLDMDDYNVGDRYSLLKQMYAPFFDEFDEKKIITDRRIFARYGGPLTFEEYMKNNGSCKREYRFIMPPMTPIIPMVEISAKNGFNRACANQGQYALGRTKPLPKVHDLFEKKGFIKKKR